MIRITTLAGLILLFGCPAHAQDATKDTRPGIAPDIRQDESRLKLQRGDFVVVPIPISNPTLDEGLVVGAAYFYPQSEEEKKLQPASVTAAAGLYTSNDSRALALVQQSYWKDGRWRFTGVIGGADLRLSLLTSDQSANGTNVDWRINGAFLFAKIARRIKGNWYGGVLTRLIDADQAIEAATSTSDFNTGSDARSMGLGAYVEYDSRDNSINSSSGKYFKFDALFNDEAIGSNTTYQSYGAAFRSYHRLTDSVVLAWELQGCQRGGTAPLWDACTIKLRGFSATDYLGKMSSSGQIEARWQLSERWGIAGFAGAGYVGSSFSGIREREAIPSYGAGLRFTVLKAKKINLRLDYARSTDSDAIHISVGEAF
ncbi:MAG: BamA/TamA family outer membrane protein [Woeseiaceae bacterium]|nr:BamA/TamA family outer membrane protein [Woeseiaceae bacterium]MDX2607591.1 BamA/TamA family outer membrane protein [Woeseiaceae bacterium]